MPRVMVKRKQGPHLFTCVSSVADLYDHSYITDDNLKLLFLLLHLPRAGIAGMPHHTKFLAVLRIELKAFCK